MSPRKPGSFSELPGIAPNWVSHPDSQLADWPRHRCVIAWMQSGRTRARSLQSPPSASIEGSV
jgi:hypothetical protein